MDAGLSAGHEVVMGGIIKGRQFARKLTGQELFEKTVIIQEMVFAEHLQYMQSFAKLKNPVDLTDEEKQKLGEQFLRCQAFLAAHAETFVLMQAELEERGIGIQKLSEKYGFQLTESAIMRDNMLRASQAEAANAEA